MTSNLSAFPMIGERSEATPGLWNYPMSILSANIAAIDQTLSLGQFQQLSIGSTPPSYLTTAAVTIEVNSAYSDYLYLVDSSAQKSSYIIGSRAGGTGDGLNIWDVSGATMIVGFSKQSVHFYSPVVGYITDLGGAVYNVKSYGALGDDSNNDGPSIRLAISAASAAGGGTIYFPPGTFKVTSQLTMGNDMQVLMQPGSVIKQYTEAEPIFNASGVSGVKFRDCVLDYNTTTVRQTIGAIYLVGSTNFEIIGCRVIKAAGMGFYTANNARGRILSNIVENTNADGIHVTNGGSSNMSSRDISIVNNIVSKTSDDGISVIGYTAGGAAINEAITITGNVISHCSTRAITVSGGQFITVTANTIRENIGNRAINIIYDAAFSTFSSENVVVANNVIEPALGAAASTRHGISIYRSPRCTVIGNQVAWHQGEGIMVYGDSTASIEDCKVIGNTVSGATVGEQGIHIQNARNIAIEGNSIVSSAKAGIYVEYTDNVRIHNNTISEANLQNVGATNLLFVGLGTRASLMGNLITQTGTAYTHAYAISTYTDVTSAHNGLRRSVAQSGETVNFTSCTSVDAWDGSESQGVPPLHSRSELSLGLYRSAASTVALSYGTLDTSVGFLSASTVSISAAQTPLNVSVSGGAGVPRMMFRGGANSADASLRIYRWSGSLQSYLATHIESSDVWSTIRVSSSFVTIGSEDVSASILTIARNGPIRARRWQADDSTALAPAFAFSSESSLGFYRSGVSSIGMSYGALMHPDGSNTTPSMGYSSNTSLGLYSSGVQTIAMSLGTLNLATNQVRFSMRTLATSSVTASAVNTNVARNEVVFTIGGASGASLIISSGGTAYIFNSASSAILA